MRYPTRILVPTFLALAAVGLFAFGCDGTDPTTPAANDLGITLQADMDGVVHRASLGGADVCEAFGLPTGCDANFSLVATEYADGRVTGQWQDTFGKDIGGGGIHVAVDCLAVDGNFAEVAGVITHGSLFGIDVSGFRAVTAVVDNGTSSNDPPDQLNLSFIPAGAIPEDCSLGRSFFENAGFLFDLANGQVTVY